MWSKVTLQAMQDKLCLNLFSSGKRVALLTGNRRSAQELGTAAYLVLGVLDIPLLLLFYLSVLMLRCIWGRLWFCRKILCKEHQSI